MAEGATKSRPLSLPSWATAEQVPYPTAVVGQEVVSSPCRTKEQNLWLHEISPWLVVGQRHGPSNEGHAGAEPGVSRPQQQIKDPGSLSPTSGALNMMS